MGMDRGTFGNNEATLGAITSDISTQELADTYVGTLSNAARLSLVKDIVELYYNDQNMYMVDLDGDGDKTNETQNLGYGYEDSWESANNSIIVTDYLLNAIAEAEGYDSVYDYVVINSNVLPSSASLNTDTLIDLSLSGMSVVSTTAFDLYGDEKKQAFDESMMELSLVNELVTIAQKLYDEQQTLLDEDDGNDKKDQAKITHNNITFSLENFSNWTIDSSSNSNIATSGVISKAGLLADSELTAMPDDFRANWLEYMPSEHIDSDYIASKATHGNSDTPGRDAFDHTREVDAVLRELQSYINNLENKADTITIELNENLTRYNESLEYKSSLIDKIFSTFTQIAQAIRS